MRDSIKSLSQMQRFCLYLMLSFAFVSVFSCSDDNENEGGSGAPYDPNQPVKITKFYPDSGGMATKVIIEGSNFGTDVSNIRVYYNDKKAAVVRSNGNMLYVITPRTPGDICNISVAIGKDSLTFNETFEYTTTTTVSTIAGRPTAEANATMTDGTLAEAEFHHPRYLCVDAERNIFVAEFHAHALRQINIESNLVTTLFKENGMTNPNAPSADPEGKTIFVPNDGGATMFEFDPERQWEGKRINISKADDSKDFTINWKHCVVANVNDGLMYTRSYNGHLVKFDGKTKMGWTLGLVEPNTDSFLAFHPKDPNLLYISFPSYHYIGIYHLDTGTLEAYAGLSGTADHQDGEREDALFNQPRQICFDKDCNLYIGDGKNHCIRKIDPDGIVTTVIGLPKISGYVDGNPDNAQFNTPDGVAIDDEGTIYIADYENRCIRKLAIE